MSRFACPGCQSVLEAGSNQPGDVIACPRCGQRLHVPGAPKPPLLKEKPDLPADWGQRATVPPTPFDPRPLPPDKARPSAPPPVEEVSLPLAPAGPKHADSQRTRTQAQSPTAVAAAPPLEDDSPGPNWVLIGLGVGVVCLFAGIGVALLLPGRLGLLVEEDRPVAADQKLPAATGKDAPGKPGGTARSDDKPKAPPDLTQDLIAKLDNNDPKTRVRAAQELAQVGPPQSQAGVPALLRGVAKYADADTRRAFLDALARIGPPARSDLDSLLEALRHSPVAEARAYAAEALAKMGSAAKPAMADLTAVLKDPEPAVRVQAARALRALGPVARETAFAVLFEALKDPDGDVRQAAQEALASIYTPALADVPVLQTNLKDASSPAVRAYAAAALGRIGPDAKPAAYADLVAALKDEEAGVREAALQALQRLGKPTRGDVPVLGRALKDPAAPAVRAFAARALGSIGPDVRDTVYADLLTALKDADKVVRDAALEALKGVGPATKAQAAALKTALEDRAGRADARHFAARTLGELGLDAEEAVPALCKVLTADDDRELLSRSAEALGKIRPATKEAGQALARAVQHADKEVSLQAALALTQIGPQSNTLEGYVKALEHPDAAVRKVAADSLFPANSYRWSSLLAAGSGPGTKARVKLGGLGADDVPVLKDALQSREVHVRKFAAFVLTMLGAAARDAVPQLQMRLKDPSLYVRTEVMSALAGIGKSAPEAVQEVVPDLQAILRDRNEDKAIRTCAAMALVMVGAGGDEAMQALVGGLKVEDLANADQLGLRADAAELLYQQRKAARDPLLKGLKQFNGSGKPDGEARLAVVQVIERLGPDAFSGECLKVLGELRRDPYTQVRLAAQKAFVEVQRKN